MARTVDLFRHTDSEGDQLTDEGVRMAVELGRRLQGPFDLMVSSGAQRATQTLACLLCGLAEPVDGGVVVDTGFRSTVEDRWREVAKRAPGKDLAAFREADPDLVESESALLASALRRLLERLPESGRALVVGHSPTQEAAVLGISGQIVAPLKKGGGVRLIQEADGYRLSDVG